MEAVIERAARCLASGALVILAGGPALLAQPALPVSTLSVARDGTWIVWWRSDSAPARWASPSPVVSRAVAWHATQAGLSRGELHLAGTGEARRVVVVIARLDPALFELRVDVRRRAGRARPWSVDDAPAGAALALNAGQFTSGGPWGWVVHRRVERRAPGAGPLAPAIVVDTGGEVRFVPPDAIAALRATGTVVEAFQSYPTLLTGDGDVPAALRHVGRGVDLAHRDARLAIGFLEDGTILVALTRFDGFGAVGSRIPLGLTTPEMSAVMGALGCRQAVMLDGGISGQLLVRDSTGVAHAWRGLRRVPLGLIALPRR